MMSCRSFQLPVVVMAMAALAGPCPLLAQAQAKEAADGEALTQHAVVIPDPGKTVSVSRQFHVLGKASPRLRNALAAEADALKEELLRLFESKDNWRHPVVIQLHDPREVSPAGPSVRGGVAAVGEGRFRFKVDVRLDAGSEPELFRREVLRALLGTFVIGRRQADEVKDGELVPPWLLHGVEQALAYRRDPGSTAVASVVFNRGKTFPVERLLQAEPAGLPAGVRVAYEASACGLVLTLLDQENGPRRLLRLIGELAGYDGDAAPLIRHHFQSMAVSKHGLDKWWALQVATMARPEAWDFYDGEESRRRLVQAMQVEVDATAGPPAEAMPLAEAAAVVEYEEWARLLRTVAARMRSLQLRVHPLFRGVAAGYEAAMQQELSRRRGGESRLVQDLDELDALRDRLAERLDAVDDYLNWWEVTRGEGDPDRLRRYLEAARPEEAKPRQDDPIGAYLDKVEAVMSLR